MITLRTGNSVLRERNDQTAECGLDRGRKGIEHSGSEGRDAGRKEASASCPLGLGDKCLKPHTRLPSGRAALTLEGS